MFKMAFKKISESLKMLQMTLTNFQGSENVPKKFTETFEGLKMLRMALKNCMRVRTCPKRP